MKKSQGAILFTCLFAVTSALVLQFFFGAQPCYLCIVERSLFIAIGITALVALLLPSTYIRLLTLCFQSAGIIYLGHTLYQHIGIDRGWWISSCDINPQFFMSDYVPYIFDVKSLCGQNKFLLFGYDLVYWGAIVALLLTCLVLYEVSVRLLSSKTGNEK